MNQAKTVTILEPTVTNILYTNPQEQPKKRVAAYARVSTEQDEQQSSYESQIAYFTEYIQSNPDWEFVEVYSDEGITGTSMKNREGFKRMIADAKAGKIDLILTKSISRFARNTVDTLQTIRELKEVGVEVIFEKDGVHTMDHKCELALTMLSSLAQDESRNISENVRWGQQRSMQAGNVAMAYGRFLGYRKGEDGKPEIVPEEAEIVRDIYRMFLDGMTIRNIAKTLTNQKIPTPSGKEVWSVSTIKSMLSNEKYKGDALRQKTFTVDYLTKKVKKNNGEYAQYYISNSHPAIIDEETFELAQLELARRSRQKGSLGNNSPFTTKIVCADCGAYFGHKVFHGKEECRKDVWYCNHRYDGQKKCNTPIISEVVLKNAYLFALGQILARRAACLANCRAQLDNTAKVTILKETRQKAEQALKTQIQEIQAFVHENAKRPQDQEKYRKKYDEIAKALERQKDLVAQLKNEELEAIAGRERIRRFINAIEPCKEVPEFTPEVWSNTVERATVSNDDTITFEFKNSETIMVNI